MKCISKYTYIGIVLIGFGYLLSLYAKADTYVMETGMVHETFATPLSALLIVLGIITVFISFFVKSK
jgi:hypothetical protein